MSFIIRKGFRFADPLAVVFCMMIVLCTAPIAAAQMEGAEVGQGANRAPVPKKKIAFAQFDVANTQHVDDINNIYDGLPSALSGRLEASGEFLSTYTGRSIPAEAGAAQREAIIQIAGETGAQFLISGLVVNAGTMQEKGYLGTSIGGYKKRHIEVELAVYDGLTGARLLQRRLSEQAQGDVRVGNNKPFGSSLFFETELGQALNRLMDIAVKDIRKSLENVPLSAHIIRVEEKKVFLDAGSDSLLKPGDKLVAYVRDINAPIAGLKGTVLGVTDRAADTVTLTQVQPQFSIGELSEDAAKLGIKAGNIASIDPAEQRNLAAKQMEAQQLARAQQEARNEAARVELERAARVEAERLKAEAERVKAEQAAKAEADRIEAEKKAQAQAKAQAAAE
ncbi:MAG TPA: flagella assembly protein FlgT middle domain-containing protein, partial [Gallionella sp.]|nr:flagella assembly protein FlgT middle domain-containing protein [Gallionella sp.]